MYLFHLSLVKLVCQVKSEGALPIMFTHTRNLTWRQKLPVQKALKKNKKMDIVKTSQVTYVIIVP